MSSSGSAGLSRKIKSLFHAILTTMKIFRKPTDDKICSGWLCDSNTVMNQSKEREKMSYYDHWHVVN
jgi:hypothetical protein